MSTHRRRKKNKALLSLIVPSYKQEKTIVKDIQKIKKITDSLSIPCEIIVVMDGQLDNTEKILKQKKIPRVTVVGYKHNYGKGYAVRYGMANSKGTMIAFLDAGMDLNPRGLTLLIDTMTKNNADIVIGSK
jgi:glycosyltransferase involved in cell wall biosynthesis